MDHSWLPPYPPPYQAYFDGEVLVAEQPAMARRYLRSDFWADLLGAVPADWLLLAAAAASGQAGHDGAVPALQWLPLLRLLHLARLYRVR